jgi:hypothetical protein
MRRRIALVGLTCVALVESVVVSALAQQPNPPTESPPVTALGNIGTGLNIGLGGPGGPGSQPTSTSSNGASGNGNTSVIPTGSSGGGDSGSGSSGPPLEWVRTYPNVTNLQGSQFFSTGTFCRDDAGNQGVNYLDKLTNTVTGEVVSTRSGCATSATPAPNAPANGATAQPQPPPTPAVIWARTPIDVPTFGVNPSEDGLTGLATWLWDPTGGSPVTANVALRGYTAHATASPVQYQWTMWEAGEPPGGNVNPYPVVSADHPGSRQDPAATYMYKTKGDYTLTMTVTWAGSYTYTDPAGATQSVDLGTTIRTATRPYHVVEIRSVLVAPQS